MGYEKGKAGQERISINKHRKPAQDRMRRAIIQSKGRVALEASHSAFDSSDTITGRPGNAGSQLQPAPVKSDDGRWFPPVSPCFLGCFPAVMGRVQGFSRLGVLEASSKADAATKATGMSLFQLPSLNIVRVKRGLQQSCGAVVRTHALLVLGVGLPQQPTLIRCTTGRKGQEPLHQKRRFLQTKWRGSPKDMHEKKRWGGAAPFRIVGSFLWGCWKLGSRRRFWNGRSH